MVYPPSLYTEILFGTDWAYDFYKVLHFLQTIAFGVRISGSNIFKMFF